MAAAALRNGREGFAFFRPLFAGKELRQKRTPAELAGQIFKSSAMSELLAFQIERLLGLYRAPPVIFSSSEFGPQVSNTNVTDAYFTNEKGYAVDDEPSMWRPPHRRHARPC
jgi:hypothetical protein